MSDADWLAKINATTDLRELMREVIEHFGNIPTDPYYRDLSDALIARCQEVLDMPT